MSQQEKLIVMSFKLSPELKLATEQKAQSLGLSTSAFIRQLLELGIGSTAEEAALSEATIKMRHVIAQTFSTLSHDAVTHALDRLPEVLMGVLEQRIEGA